VTEGLLDTSVFIASETGRALRSDLLPAQGFVSVITAAALRAGVLVAPTTRIRARRLATLEAIAALELLPIDDRAAASWAEMRVALRESGLRVNVNDLWIAAVAASRGIPVITQDAEFAPLAELGLVSVVEV
jgi:predicted nucleic acid-binding protein